MNINTWGIIHIIAAFLCLLGMLVFKQKKGFPRHVYIVFCAITVMHILGFLWHSVDNHFLPNALLLFAFENITVFRTFRGIHIQP